MSGLYPYQAEGATFLEVRQRALLADQPGLGKTIQAIKAAQRAGIPVDDILVLCPKSAVGNWFREFETWADEPSDMPPTVLNYDIFSQSTLGMEARNVVRRNRPWGVLICDEAHRLKSTGARRTQNVYRHLVPNCDRVWLLTGTPTPNHNGELFTHLRALVPSLIADTPTLREFEDTYCRVDTHPRWGRRILGNRNTDVLREKIRPFVLRRKKSDVLEDLPDLTFSTYPVRVGPSLSLPTLPPKLRGLTGDELLAALRAETPHLATERRLLGVLKVPAVYEVIQDELYAGHRKLIVFAHHREVLDGLENLLTQLGDRVARIDGQTSGRARQEAVDRFQTDPDCEVFLGQIAACGEALTLTAASQVLFAEFSWSPSDNYQAACRAHRIGQKNPVNARLLAVEGSLDDDVARVVARKTREVAALFG